MKKMIRLPREIRQLTNLLLRELDTPCALGSFILLKYDEYDQLATRAIDPASYLDTPSGVEKYRRDAQAVDWLRKLEQLPSTIDRKGVAEINFQAAEEQCASTNYLLRHLRAREWRSDRSAIEVHALDILSRAKKTISKLIGRVPDKLHGRFGPGTSYELQGSRYNTLADKMWVTPHVTRAAMPVWEHTIAGLPWHAIRLGLGLPYLAVCRGNRFTTVPKDGKGDRGICIEPLGNLWCQLGIGGYWKERLAYAGIFVHREVKPPRSDPLRRMLSVPSPNGQEIHRWVAEKASRDGSWDTIDLSNASDTVSFELVKELFSPDWFELLCCLRSPKTRFKGSWVHLEKFSSMGNGFTFELETLIFCGLISAVTGLEPGVNFFVYGDDILVPHKHSKAVLACLRMFGFTPNEKKTHTTGFFRESCGGDFFCGNAVRSVFMKTLPTDALEWMDLHNRLYKAGFRGTVLRQCIEQVPVAQRVGIPLWFESGGFYGLPLKLRKADCITYCRTFHQDPVGYPIDRWGAAFGVLLISMGLKEPIVPRGHPQGMKMSWSSVS